MITDFASSSYLGDVEMIWGEYVARMLEKLFFDKEFIREVEDFRRKERVPVSGFKTMEAYERYLKKHPAKKKRFAAIGKEMAKDRKLPGIYAYWIEGFLWIDFMCALYMGVLDARMIPGHGYAAIPRGKNKNDYVDFRIYDGASIKGFLRFIKRFSFLLEDSSGENKKLPQVRKTNIARNAEIFILYKDKKLNMDGVWYDHDSHNKSDRPKCIRGISADSIRKIIIEERRKEKMIYRHDKSK